jgi:hypothetical protein
MNSEIAFENAEPIREQGNRQLAEFAIGISLIGYL